MTTKRLFLTAFLLFGFTAAAADWTTVAPGVDYQEFVADGLDVHVTRIDLTDDAVRVVVSRESERGMRVSEFAKKNHAIAAINGDYFDEKFNPVGLTIGPCGTWTGSKDTKREGVIAVGDGKADIQKPSEVMEKPEEWMNGAISGWPMLVSNCKVSTPLPGSATFTTSPHPRTAVGLSKDRQTLYFVVADGRRTGVPGLTLPQLAAFMHDTLDVCSAINLDGGGSSAMWVGDKVVNRPSDGIERKVGDHIAVVARSDYAGCDVTQPAMLSSSKPVSTTPATTPQPPSTLAPAGTTTVAPPATSTQPR